jgi:hypothetical protein
VSAVGFVDNPRSNDSRLQTLTISEYQARRLAHQITQQIVVSGTAAGSADPDATTAAGSAASPASDLVPAAGG